VASTASWTGILQLARTRLLTFVSISGGSSLATRLGATASGSGSDGKLFLDQAPDSVTSSGFWGILRTIDEPPDGADGGLMLKGAFELQLFARGRTNAAAMRGMADLCVEAWHGWVHTEVGGHISSMGVTNRFMVPYESDPADRELVQVRMLLAFRCTPMFLLKYTNAA
jgi:hypothetical protein